jgi:hypothetical protein
MVLVLKESWTVLEDASELYVEDSTQEYIDGDNGGWGVGTNPNREDRCLIFFCKYIDYEGKESYFDLKSAYLGSEKKIGVAPGTGLSNSDKSTFTVVSTKDGHHSFTMIPVTQQASEPESPTTYDMYYSTSAGKAYMYISGAWAELSASHLPYAEDNSSAKTCEKLFDFRISMKRNSLIWKLADEDMSDDASTIGELDELNALMEGAWSKFEAGLKPTARKLLEKARKASINY